MSFPAARRLQLPPLRLPDGSTEPGIATLGARSRRGPAVVLCHGFPELGYSWRHQIAALAAAGFRVIAPDQRGYGASDARADRGLRHPPPDRRPRRRCSTRWGSSKAVFVGHDWGGFVVWAMPFLHPERVAGVIGVNTPLMPRAPMPPIAADAHAGRRQGREAVHRCGSSSPASPKRVLDAARAARVREAAAHAACRWRRSRSAARAPTST